LIERLELAPGYAICRLVNGGWQLSQGHREGPFDEREVVADLRRLVEAGLTTFDCADIYLGVEELLGALLRDLGRSADAPRIEIHTKCVPDRSALATIDRRGVGAIVERSLRRLGVERLDLVQFHWWDYAVPRYIEVAGWLADLQREGKIRLLGTTNFDTPRLRELADSGFPIATHQAQYSVLDRRPEAAMVDFCRERGIHLLCYGAVAGGFLAARYLGLPEPEGPLPNRSLTKYKLILDEFGSWELFQNLLQALAEIGRKHGVGPTPVAVRWVLERPQVAAVLLGTRNATHLEQNRQVFQFHLDREDLERLGEVQAQALGPPGEPFALEREPGGRHAVIMKTDLNRAGRS
jgi:aryl-alcohol dehydrogenase-like predicted oxidoreductase